MPAAVVHIPKCAGSTLREELSKIDGAYTGPLYFDDSMLGEREVDGADPQVIVQIATSDDLRSVVEKSRVVIGHVAAESFILAGVGRLWVQVREPRARLLSLYRYWQVQSPGLEPWGERGERIANAVKGSFGEFLGCDLVVGDVVGDIARYVLPSSMRVLTPEGAWRLAPEFASLDDSDSVLAGLEGLRGHLVGAVWSNDLRTTLEQVAARVGNTLGPIDSSRVANPTPPATDRQSIGTRELELLERATRADRFVLDWLMDEGYLARRTQEQLDSEFLVAAAKHGISID